MKKYLFIILLLIVWCCPACSPAYAQTPKPAPPGWNIFLKSGDNATFGRVTGDNLLFKEAQIGTEIVENRIPNSGDFENAAWTAVNMTVTEKTLVKASNATARVSNEGDIEMIGKKVTMILKCTALTEEAQEVGLRISGTIEAINHAYKVQLNEPTTLRLSTNLAAVAQPKVFIENLIGETGDYPWSVSVDEVIMRETMPIALKIFGDSIAGAGSISPNAYEADCFGFYYANKYQVEMETHALAGEKVAGTLQSLKDNTDPSQQIPIIMALTGTNDIRSAAEDNETFVINMNAKFDAMVAEASTVTAKFVLLTILPRTAVAWTAWMEVYRDEINTHIRTLASDTVEIVDLDTFDTGKLDIDGTHPTPEGQLEILDFIDATFDFPRHIDTYAYVKTFDDYITSYEDIVKRYEYANTVRHITTSESILVPGEILEVDDTTVSVNLFLPLTPYRGQYYEISKIAGGNVTTANGNGNTIQGAATQIINLDSNMPIRFNGTEWRIK